MRTVATTAGAMAANTAGLVSKEKITDGDGNDEVEDKDVEEEQEGVVGGEVKGGGQ